MSTPRLSCAALLSLAAAAPATAQVVFPVAFDPRVVVLSETERLQLAAHVREAGRRWVAQLALDGPRSLEVEIVLSDAVPRATGQSVVAALVGHDGVREVYEQGAAHELRTGADQNGAQADIRITVNPAYLRQELWFDPEPAVRSAPVPATRTDAMSVMLHEFGHALAYNGWSDAQGASPAGYWSTFDRWMMAGTPILFDGPAVLGAHGSRPELTSGNVHHWANASSPKGLAGRAPPAWAQGAPQPHAACDGVPSAAPPSEPALKGALPDGLVYELMNGVVFYRGARYDVSALDRAALLDAGLPVDLTPVFDDGFE